MISEERIKKFNDSIVEMSIEEINDKNNIENKKAEEDFKKLKESLSEGKCHYCNNQIDYFSKQKPCLHWLLKPKRFKKKHFPLLYNIKSFHEIEAYLRWVANIEKPFKNISNLIDEKSNSKLIEETIKYKNLEWSFSCSHGDRKGHQGKFEGSMPHYHFQMKEDGNVVINYNGFHIPFVDHDEFCFALKEGKFERLRSVHTHGAGMQELFELDPDTFIDNLKVSDDVDSATINTSIMISADEGTTISGDQIADLFEESKATGVSMAKLVKNIKTQVYIEPGLGVPEIAKRNKNRK
jgi:hypothetical protein